MTYRIRVKDYVRWLLSGSKGMRMPKWKTSDVEMALRTAALLLRAPARSPEVANQMGRIAYELCCLPVRVGAVKPAQSIDAVRFLAKYGMWIPGGRVEFALTRIRRLTEEQRASLAEPSVWNTHVEYRGRKGMVLYYTKGKIKKWPSDDLTERIWQANHALRLAGCPNSPEYIAKKLGVDWDHQRVESRLKTKACKQFSPKAWLMTYWLQLDSSNQALPSPDEFEFTPFRKTAGRSPRRQKRL